MNGRKSKKDIYLPKNKPIKIQNPEFRFEVENT